MIKKPITFLYISIVLFIVFFYIPSLAATIARGYEDVFDEELTALCMLVNFGDICEGSVVYKLNNKNLIKTNVGTGTDEVIDSRLNGELSRQLIYIINEYVRVVHDLHKSNNSANNINYEGYAELNNILTELQAIFVEIYNHYPKLKNDYDISLIVDRVMVTKDKAALIDLIDVLYNFCLLGVLTHDDA